MLRGLRWFSLAAIVATAALVGPTAALACDRSGSAVAIYSGPCVPTAKGGSHTHGGKKPTTTTTQSGGTSSSGYGPAPVVVHVSRVTKHALKHSGKDKKTLTNLVKNPDLVDAQRLKPVLASSPTRASSLDSAFDLGAGPMILFGLLLGTVLVLLGVGGVRTWRNRHRV